MIDDPRDEFLIFFSRILPIQNTIRAIAESSTSETVMSIVSAIDRIEYIRYFPKYPYSKTYIHRIIANLLRKVYFLSMIAKSSIIHGKIYNWNLHFLTISYILSISYISTMAHILTIYYIFTIDYILRSDIWEWNF